jgi:hypothetical protein
MDNAIAFQLPELLGEHLLRNAVQGAKQLGEALFTSEELPDNQDFPSATNDL